MKVLTEFARLDAPSPARAIWSLCLILSALVLAGVDRHVVTLLVHPIETDLGISDTQISLLQGMAFIVIHAIATLFIGWLADRGNRRDILFAGVVFWSAMTGFSGLAPTFLVLLIVRGGVGIGEAAIVPAGFSLVADHFASERRGVVTGILSAATVAGAGLALLIGGFILALIGPQAHILPLIGVAAPWRMTFMVLGMAGLPMALAMLTLTDVRRFSTRPNANLDRSESAMSLFAYLRDHWTTFSAVLGAAACNAVVGVGAASWAPTVLIRRFGLPAPQAGYLVGVAVIVGGVIGSIGATALSDIWVRRRAWGGRLRGHPIIMATATVGLSLFAFGPSPAVCAMGYAVLSAGVNAISAISYTAVQDLAPSGARGRLLGLMHFVAALLGYAAGPTLIALVTDYVYHSQAALPLALLTIALPLYLLGAFLALRGLRPYSATYEMLNPREV